MAEGTALFTSHFPRRNSILVNAFKPSTVRFLLRKNWVVLKAGLFVKTESAQIVARVGERHGTGSKRFERRELRGVGGASARCLAAVTGTKAIGGAKRAGTRRNIAGLLGGIAAVAEVVERSAVGRRTVVGSNVGSILAEVAFHHFCLGGCCGKHCDGGQDELGGGFHWIVFFGGGSLVPEASAFDLVRSREPPTTLPSQARCGFLQKSLGRVGARVRPSLFTGTKRCN